ncbi:hypothetical protein DPMN_044556, partial [Dreissena polymorpha]
MAEWSKLGESCSSLSKEKHPRKRKSVRNTAEDIDIKSEQNEDLLIKKAKKDADLRKAGIQETTDNIERHKKKKKSKHNKASGSCDDTDNLGKVGLMSIHKNSSMLKNGTDLTVGNQALNASHVDKVDSKQNSVDSASHGDKEESKQNSVDSAEETNDTCHTAEIHKRRRIRKRKRKNKKSVQVVDNLSNLTNNNSLNMVQEGDTFFGRLPDKLEPPKYYRAGYRNLKTYQAQPNLHRKFDSGSDVEEGSLEQYNFLSKPQQSDHSVDGHQLVDISWEDDMQNNTFTAIKIESSDTMYNSNNHNTHNAMLTDQTEYTNGHVEASVSIPGQKIPATQWGRASNLSETSTPAEPVKLTQVTLGNGAALFTRQRAARPPNNELSKEQQLNDNAYNKSTIFKNDRKGNPVEPESPCHFPATRTAQSLCTPENVWKVPDKKANNNSAMQEFMHALVSPFASEMHVPSGSPVPVKSNNNPQSLVNTDVGVDTNAANFYKLPPLVGIPSVGDKIVYKILEISASCTPEVSDFKVAIVTKVNDNQMIELHNQQQTQGNVINKFHVEMEDEDAILTNFQQPQDIACLHVSSLLDARMFE